MNTFTFTDHELRLILDGLRREAVEARKEYRRCHRGDAHPSVLGQILARKQEILDLADRVTGQQPAAVSATPDQVELMFADLERRWGFDVLGNTDAEIVRSWEQNQPIGERRAV